MRSLVLGLVTLGAVAAWYCFSERQPPTPRGAAESPPSPEVQMPAGAPLARSSGGSDAQGSTIAGHERQLAVERDVVPAHEVSRLLLSLDQEAREKVHAARRAGVVSDDDLLLLGDCEAREEFLRVWAETSQVVRDAEAARNRLFKAYSAEEFRSGRYVETLVDESERAPDGGFRMERFIATSHPDEYCATQMLHREGGGQTIRQVRVAPGQHAGLDRATTELRLAEELRCTAIRNVLAFRPNRFR